jgi:hypothetical protein
MIKTFLLLGNKTLEAFRKCSKLAAPKGSLKLQPISLHCPESKTFYKTYKQKLKIKFFENI